MAFTTQMSREHQLWSLLDLSDQVKARDTHGQKQFAKALRSLSHHPVDVVDDMYHAAEQKGFLLVQANTTRLDTSLVYQRELYGIKLYEKMSNSDSTSGTLVVQGVSAVAGTVPSILNTFNMRHSKAFTSTMQTLLPSIVCQGATVASDNDATHVHWMSVVGLNDDHRLSDVLFMSASQLYESSPATCDDLSLVATKATDNVAYGTHIWESITLSSPALQHLALFGPADTKCVRLHVVNSGFFIEPGDVDDVCRVTFSFSCHLTGADTAHHPRLRQWMEGVVVTGLQQLAATCRSSHLQLVPRQKWAESNSCHLCTTSFRFNVLRRRHHCRLCGQSICSACSTFVTLETVVDPSLGHRSLSAKLTQADSVRSCLLCAFAEKSTKVPPKTPSSPSSSSGTRTPAVSIASTTGLSSMTQDVSSKASRMSTTSQHSQRVPSASRASLALTATTTGSSFRDSFPTRTSSTHDSFPSSPVRHGNWMRASLGKFVLDPADMAARAALVHRNDRANVNELSTAVPSGVQSSPTMHSHDSSVEWTRSSLSTTTGKSRHRRRSLQTAMPDHDAAEGRRRAAVGDSLTMSCYGDVRMSERHARRAAMLERSNSYLEMAMLKATTPTRGWMPSEKVNRPPADSLLLQEFGITELVSGPSLKVPFDPHRDQEQRATAAPVA
ncbi:hypothetical protein H310_13280 [Aphanomyces invadans]|uniref:FYVE-type domain-containing protein n=1 Tax=Aphanomyces invadans TaxID=157072 RepID=A0A024TE35_9STRA|nr:hypothetical protein H310_13280 [Aphanomyces invadans]ETV92385.1 hypothetical protein H310_13280 [Aphanomyces invadans]|eukprot:XP_008878936.1 hypothetical protein H310_13280 [Aphanomyces invadans]